jgi:hypothetical protein
MENHTGIEKLAPVHYSTSRTVDGVTYKTEYDVQRYKINGEAFEWSIELHRFFCDLLDGERNYPIMRHGHGHKFLAKLIRADMIDVTEHAIGYITPSEWLWDHKQEIEELV